MKQGMGWIALLFLLAAAVFAAPVLTGEAVAAGGLAGQNAA